MFKKIYFLILLFLSSISNSYSNIEIKARTVILQDFLSGEILYEKDPDIQIYPASMTKIMTSIIAFDLIKSGNLSFR
jgi:D-alanyl-D-alanine carboxypeptidase (penicillin-binding protein 5/6)